MSYFELLLLIHIGGAIVGFGPTMAFAILGPMAPQAGPEGGLAIMKAMVKIEKRLVWPAAFVTQPLTGVLMIFESRWSDNFFSHEWLVTAIVVYMITFYIAVFVQTPTLDRMIELAEKGEGPTPEFASLAAKAKRNGPLLTIGLLVIIVMMVLKPGS